MPGKPKQASFFAIDFDRCLGDINKSFDLLVKVIAELDQDLAISLSRKRQEVEASGGSFNPYLQIRKAKNIELATVKERYIEKAKEEHITESGAHDLINFLVEAGQPFSIISYGDESWQRLKIEAAGFGKWPVCIVDSPKKAKIIAKWQISGGEFKVPAECFGDLSPRLVQEVVLIDDKAVSFESLPMEARGYWVHNSQSRKGNNESIVIPRNVTEVDSLCTIIELETDLV